MKKIKDLTEKQKGILLSYFISNQKNKGNSIIVAVTDDFEAYTYDLDYNILTYTTQKMGSINLDCEIETISEIIIDKKIKKILINSEFQKVKEILKDSFKLFEGLDG